MEDPLKVYNDVLKITGGEAVANEMPFVAYDTKKWVCPECGESIPIINSVDDPETTMIVKDHLRNRHGFSENQIDNTLGIDYHSRQAQVYNARAPFSDSKSYFDGKWYDRNSYSDEADNYPQKQQMSQADWNDDLDDMRNQFSDDKSFIGANDEIEEDDGLDEDRVEIDISGDDVEIEDFDDDDVEIEDYDDEEIEDTVNESWRLHYSFGGDPIGVDEYDVNPNVEPDYNLYECDYCHRLINISREDPVEHLKIHNISDAEEFSDQGGDDEPEMEAEWKEIENEAHDITATGKYDNSSDFQWHKADSSDLLRIDQPRLDAYGNSMSSWKKVNTDTMGRADRLSDNPTKGYNESYSSEDYGMYNVIDNPNLETHGYPRDEEGFARASWDDATIEDRKNWLIVSRGTDPEIAEDEAYKPYFSLDTYTRAELIKDLQIGGIHAMGTGYL